MKTYSIMRNILIIVLFIGIGYLAHDMSIKLQECENKQDTLTLPSDYCEKGVAGLEFVNCNYNTK